MQYCPKCKVNIRGEKYCCPLCQGKIKEVDDNINELKTYFNTVIDWVTDMFYSVEKEMRSINWGQMYERFHSKPYDKKQLKKAEKEVNDSIKEAEDYLDSYVPKLMAQGYDIVNPQAVGCARQNCYLNEELGKLVGFDITPAEEGAQILFELVSFEEQEESLVTKVLTSR